MTPIQTLLSLDIPDAKIARRLRVSKRTVARWRGGHCSPSPLSLRYALVYLKELYAKISPLISLT